MTLKYVKSNQSGMEQVDFSARTWQKLKNLILKLKYFKINDQIF